MLVRAVDEILGTHTIRASTSASRTLAPLPASPQQTSARVRSAENRSSTAWSTSTSEPP